MPAGEGNAVASPPLLTSPNPPRLLPPGTAVPELQLPSANSAQLPTHGSRIPGGSENNTMGSCSPPLYPQPPVPRPAAPQRGSPSPRAAAGRAQRPRSSHRPGTPAPAAPRQLPRAPPRTHPWGSFTMRGPRVARHPPARHRAPRAAGAARKCLFFFFL